MLKNKYHKRYTFRVSQYESLIIEEVAKLFSDNGIPNYSAAIRFFIDYFIAHSFLDQDTGKKIITSLYDDYINLKKKRLLKKIKG